MSEPHAAVILSLHSLLPSVHSLILVTRLTTLSASRLVGLLSSTSLPPADKECKVRRVRDTRIRQVNRILSDRAPHGVSLASLLSTVRPVVSPLVFPPLPVPFPPPLTAGGAAQREVRGRGRVGEGWSGET